MVTIFEKVNEGEWFNCCKKKNNKEEKKYQEAQSFEGKLWSPCFPIRSKEEMISEDKDLKRIQEKG